MIINIVSSTALVLAISSLGIPSANALQFKENCASMQQYFQSRLSRNSAGDYFSYSGFNGKRIFVTNRLCRRGLVRDGMAGTTTTQFIHSASCSGGYITIKSPLGTQACVGNMTYTDPRVANIEGWHAGTFAEALTYGIGSPGANVAYNNCRWR